VAGSKLIGFAHVDQERVRRTVLLKLGDADLADTRARFGHQLLHGDLHRSVPRRMC